MSSARIALINPVGVDTSALSNIAEAAALPSGEVLLIVGDAKLPAAYQGACLLRELASQAADLFGFEDHLDRNWDCGITIGETWSRRQNEFPAYFAYLLGHELGHATTALANPGLAIYEDLITSSRMKIRPGHKWRWDDFPHELIYDEFGLAIADQLFGRERIAKEFGEIIGRGLSDDVPRLERIMAMTPSRDLTRVHPALAAFAEPAKYELIDFWDRMRDSGSLKQASRLGNFARFWDAS